MKKKILTVVLNDVINTVGGAVTAFYNFQNMLIENNYEAYGLFNSKKADKFYEKVNGLKLYNFKNYNLKTLVEIENPDLIIFFYPRDVLKTLKDDKIYENIPKILMNHTRPDFYIEYELIKDKLQNFNAVQVLFDSFKPMLKPYYNGAVTAIGNEVPTFDDSNNQPENKNIIYLSRVDIWKGQDFLIKSFSKIAKKYPDWKLNIYGQFDPKRYKKYLQKLIKKYGLENQIFLNGATNEPYLKLKEADFCVFPSYFEGFGLGLAEALSNGLPAIGFKGATGINELIIDDENGFLVEEDEAAFAEKIEYLINNREKRLEMGINAKNSVKKYSKEIITQKWLNLIEKVLNNEELNIDTPNTNLKYEPFSINKIYDIMYKKRCMSFIQKLFSISNLGREKMICIFGIKFKIKRI